MGEDVGMEGQLRVSFSMKLYKVKDFVSYHQVSEDLLIGADLGCL
jgi:hypothetical protein